VLLRNCMQRVGFLLMGAALLMAHAEAAAAQQSPPDEPLFVVESFLAARNAGDPFGATGWCAASLVLQDADDVWFPDEPGTRYWLRQLTDKYLLDTVSPPVANGTTVTWTERLTQRSLPFPQALASSMTIDVQAVVRDGKITALSAPYPPLPVRPPPGATAGPTGREAATTAATVAPATMFFGSTLVLTLTVLLFARGVPALRAAFNRSW
jgi:hypothetical protein